MGKGKNKTNQKQEKYQQEKNRDEKKDVEQVIEKEKWKQEQIREEGSTVLNENEEKHNIQLITIIGEVEGHDVLGNNTKATKYEHILPALASI